MPLKRNGNGADEDLTGREKKKLKVSAARTIAVQPNAQAGPSSAGAASSSRNAQLPSTIDLEKFVEARAFEINAMHTAMKTASASSTHRVWQTLPRHLRRRAASHDVRRVPLRLRDRAAAEMDPARKNFVPRKIPRRGKEKRVSRTDSFLKRQRDKIWLETHLWHAKRMHMENMWGYRLALSPTEKSYRPSHRASVHGSILHDASYYSCFEIRGSEQLIVAMLEQCCDPQGPGVGSARYLTGSRILETHLYATNSFPHGLIAPATVMWKPQPQPRQPPSPKPVDRKGKGKAIDPPPPNPSTTTSSSAPGTRSVWLRFHPSVFAEVFEVLKEAASQTLQDYKEQQQQQQQNNDEDAPEGVLELVNMQGLLNVFEIMGPKASQVIKGALTPVGTGKRGAFAEFWSSLTNLQCAGSLPRGMVVGFMVEDPRLKFPPKNAKPNAQASSPNITYPSSQLAESEIWDDTVRSKLAKPRFKKKELDERRSKNDIPGTTLHARRDDDRIPVLLIQRSLENRTSLTSPDTQTIHGWTLIVPAGWSMPFFSSLVFTNTRVGGQRERQTQAFEAGLVYFPRDYPGTSAYRVYAAKRASEDRAEWERKPPAKRVNYEKVGDGLGSPWRVDWEGVVGMPSREGNSGDAGEGFVSTQRDENEDVAMQVGEDKTLPGPWLLRGVELPKILDNLRSSLNPSVSLLADINAIRAKRKCSPLSVAPNSVEAEQLVQGALVNVKVTMLLRGAPEDHAVVYALSDEMCRKWKKLMHCQKVRAAADDETGAEIELATIIPEASAIVGRVTTGHYSLMRGHGFAIGCVPLTKLLELEQQSSRLHPNQNVSTKSMPILVGVQNLGSQHCRVAALEVLLDA